MNKMNTSDTGVGRLVFADLSKTLFWTTKCYFVEVDANGEERVLHRDDAIHKYDVALRDCDFDSLVHQSSNQSSISEDFEFNAEKNLQLKNRFGELQRMPLFNHCLISSKKKTQIVSLDVDDHDEIDRMKDQQFDSLGHWRSGFAANLPNPEARWLEGHLVGEDDNYWPLKFWHTQKLCLNDAGDNAQICPHIWAQVEGAEIESDSHYRLIARCVTKAILSFQVQHESFFGRNPHHAGIMKFPGEQKIFQKKFVCE